MYIISNFTGKIYLEGQEVPKDDRDIGYQKFLNWVYSNEPEYVDFTDIEIAESKKIKEANIREEYRKKISELLAYHVEKNLIEGIEIPESVLKKRTELIDECRETIKQI